LAETTGSTHESEGGGEAPAPKTPLKEESLVRRSVQWTGVSILTYPMGLLYSIVLARGLGPAGRGEYAALLTVCTFLAGVLSLGLGIVARADVAKSPERFRTAHATLLWYAVAVGAFALLLLPAGTPAVARLLGIRKPQYLIFSLLGVPLLVYGMTWQLLMQSVGRFLSINALRIAKAFLDPGLLVIGFIVLHRTVTGALFAWYLAGLLLTIASVSMARRFASGLGRGSIKLLRGYLKHGWKLVVSSQAIAIQLQGSILLLVHFHPGVEVGIFAVAMGLATQLGIVFGTVAVVTSDQLASPDERRAASVLASVNRLLLACAIPIGVGFLIGGTLIVRILYGIAYVPSGRILWFLAASFVVSQCTEICAQYLIAQHWNTSTILWMNVANLAVGLGLGLALIPGHGAVGAAIAISVAQVLNAVAYLWVGRKLAKLSWNDMLIVRAADIEPLRRAFRRRGRGLAAQ
jgi:O-antigen/teichoic acid export membrane protein